VPAAPLSMKLHSRPESASSRTSSPRRAEHIARRDTGRAMSEKSTTPDLLELAGRQLEAANRHDLDAFMSVFAPDAVYDASRDGLGVYEGTAAIRGLIGGWWDAFDDLRLTPEAVLDLGNGVLFAAIRHDARPVGSAAYVNTHQAYVFVIVEGLVAQTTVYRDVDEARAAAERLAEERG